jgi:predicted DNA-binding transcriptional regulator YafY
MSSKKLYPIEKSKINNQTARFKKLQRQNRIAKVLAKNPYTRHDEIADMLNVSVTTVNKDVNEINTALNQETLISTFIHRQRILEEINSKKRLCSEKFAQCRGAMAGTRWIEEWTKLIEKEAKILGIYSPDRKIVAHIDTSFTKEQRDAAVKAALLVEDVIDVSSS